MKKFKSLKNLNMDSSFNKNNNKDKTKSKNLKKNYSQNFIRCQASKKRKLSLPFAFFFY